MQQVVPRKIITVTEIGAFMRCRLMWSYMYQERIAPIREQTYFFHGRMVHRTLENWANNPDINPDENWAGVVKEEVEFFKERYTQQIGVGPNNAEVDVMLADSMLPREMLNNYKLKWKTPLPEGYEFLQAEQTCIVEIPNPFNNIALVNAFLEGTLDGLIINVKTRRLYVLENKSYEKRPNIETLNHNHQFTGYAWIVKQLFPDYDLGGVFYNGLWKREKPPKGKSFDDLFFRHFIEKTSQELLNWEHDLTSVATDILSSPLIYPNRVWAGCYDDKSYGPLCSARIKGEDEVSLREAYYGPRDKVKWFEDSNVD